MLNYAATSFALLAGCLVLSLLAMPLGAVLFAFPFAAYWARGWKLRAAGLFGLAFAGGVIATGQFTQGLSYSLIAATLGVPFGLGLKYRWTYGWTATACVAAQALLVTHVFTRWGAWMALWREQFDVFIGQFQEQTPATDKAQVEALVTSLTWLKDQWENMVMGLLVAGMLMLACVGLSALTAWLRRRGEEDRIRGTFRTMRSNEWLVWAAILLAGLIYVETLQPNAMLRVVSWNSAIALSSVYWLNGLSIVMYALDILRPHLLVVALVAITLAWSGLSPMLCFVGFFDTWSDFRAMVDRVAAFRDEIEKRGNDDDDEEK